MYSQKLLIGLLAAYPVLGERCDVHMNGELPPQSLQLLKRQAPAPPPIDLIVHVVAASERREDGYLTVYLFLARF